MPPKSKAKGKAAGEQRSMISVSTNMTSNAANLLGKYADPSAKGKAKAKAKASEPSSGGLSVVEESKDDGGNRQAEAASASGSDKDVKPKTKAKGKSKSSTAKSVISSASVSASSSVGALLGGQLVKQEKKLAPKAAPKADSLAVQEALKAEVESKNVPSQPSQPAEDERTPLIQSQAEESQSPAAQPSDLKPSQAPAAEGGKMPLVHLAAAGLCGVLVLAGILAIKVLSGQGGSQGSSDGKASSKTPTPPRVKPPTPSALPKPAWLSKTKTSTTKFVPPPWLSGAKQFRNYSTGRTTTRTIPQKFRNHVPEWMEGAHEFMSTTTVITTSTTLTTRSVTHTTMTVAPPNAKKVTSTPVVVAPPQAKGPASTPKPLAPKQAFGISSTTTTQQTTKKPSEVQATTKVQMSIQNVDLKKLDQKAKDALKDGLRRTIAKNAGVAESSVSMALQPGSIKVIAKVSAPAGSVVSIDKDGLTQDALQTVKSIPAVVKAADGPLTVSPPKIQVQQKKPKKVTTSISQDDWLFKFPNSTTSTTSSTLTTYFPKNLRIPPRPSTSYWQQFTKSPGTSSSTTTTTTTSSTTTATTTTGRTTMTWIFVPTTISTSTTSTTSTTIVVGPDEVATCTGKFEIDIETETKPSVSELIDMVKPSLAAALGVPPDQITNVTIVDEADEGAENKGRRLSVKSIDHIEYEVVVPPGIKPEAFVKENQQLQQEGSVVQDVFKKKLSDDFHVKVKKLVPEESPHLAMRPKVANKWPQILLGALVIIFPLGLISVCVLRRSRSRGSSGPRDPSPRTRRIVLTPPMTPLDPLSPLEHPYVVDMERSTNIAVNDEDEDLPEMPPPPPLMLPRLPLPSFSPQSPAIPKLRPPGPPVPLYKAPSPQPLFQPDLQLLQVPRPAPPLVDIHLP